MKPTVLAPWTRQAEMPVAKIEAISMITPKMKIPDGGCHDCHREAKSIKKVSYASTFLTHL